MNFLRRLPGRNIADEQTRQQQPTGGNQRCVPRLSGYSWLIILVGILIIGGNWLNAWQQIDYDYDRTIDAATQDTMNVAKAFEEHVRRVVADMDKDLLNLKLAYEQDGLSSPFFPIYASTVSTDPGQAIVAIYDEQGTAVRSFNKDAAAVGCSDREYFLIHQDNDSNKLTIGKPVLGRITGQTVIPLTRRVNKPDGSFGGIVYIGLKTDYFLSFGEKIDLGENQLISLIDKDGAFLIRKAGTRLDSGLDNRESRLWQSVQTGLQSETHRKNSRVDGINRIVSYRVMPDYPLTVVTGKSAEVALADHEQRKQDYIMRGLWASLLILILGGLAVNRHEKLLGKEGELVEHRDKLQTLVTERTQELESTLSELRRSSAKIMEQAQLLELAHDYILVTDMDRKIIFWNRGAETGYGWLAREAIGQTSCSLLKPQSPVSEDKMEKLLADGRWEGDLIQTAKDGRQVLVKSYRTLNRDAAGNPVSILEINHDITEQKKLETEITRFDRLNLIGEMATAIGHEVRNPLTTVRGYLQMYQRKNEKAEHFKTMIEEIDRANAIITEFLSLAKNKAVQLKPNNLNDIVCSLLPLLQSEAFRTGHDVQFDKGDIPDVNLDEKEIRQLLLNLARNGFEAMRQGGRLTIKTFAKDDKVVLAVRDTGKGIPPDILGRLGTPFMTTKEMGTGLGLPVCYQIAERNGAKIDVKTSPEGTTFSVIFKR